MPANAWAADPAERTQAELGSGNHLTVGGRYAKDGLVFADFDGDGDEELLTQTELFPYQYPRSNFATVLRWNPADGGRVEWSRPVKYRMQMLVGNIDDDPLPEVILFDHFPPELRVIQWDDGRFVETEFNFAGKIGLLADVDGDGRDELVLVQVRIPLPEGTYDEPSNLVAYAYRGGRFAVTHKRELEVGFAALASVDVNGDGRHEVVASESSYHSEVSGRLAVYRFEPGGAVPVAFRRNGVLENVNFLGAFHTGGGVYLLAETWYGWQSVFRLRDHAGTLRVAPVGADSAALPVFEAAHLATAAYSAEQDEYFQFVQGDKTRLVPARSTR